MIKHIALRIIRYRIRNYLPVINIKYYKKLFSLSYKFFVFLKPSQLWVIILALLNKTDLTNLISIPSILILFNSVFSDSDNSPSLSEKKLLEKLTINKFTDSSNKWESFFWVLILLALVKRFTVIFFKLLWIPFKIALIYYTLKYFGYDFSYVYNILNNLSLGIIDWFHDKITSFFDLIKSIWKK